MSSCLHEAARYEHIDMAVFLIETGVNMFIENEVSFFRYDLALVSVMCPQ